MYCEKHNSPKLSTDTRPQMWTEQEKRHFCRSRAVSETSFIMQIDKEC